MTDFLDEKRREIEQRLKELRPSFDEHGRLEAALAALDSVNGSAPTATVTARRGPGRPRGTGKRPPATPRKGPGRPRGAKASKAAKDTPAASTKTTTATSAKAAKPKGSRRGRRKGSGERSTEAYAIIVETPGLKIDEIAAKMGIKHNYLYRVLPGLADEGKIERRSDRGWYPKGAAKG